MHRVIPFGDRIMVKRRTIGDKVGSIFLPESTGDRPTDLADVIYVPDLSFADKQIMENAEKIILALSEKVSSGDSVALEMLMKLNDFIKQKSIKVGDAIMISKYVGTDFSEKGSSDTLTLCRADDIIGLVVDNG